MKTEDGNNNSGKSSEGTFVFKVGGRTPEEMEAAVKELKELSSMGSSESSGQNSKIKSKSKTLKEAKDLDPKDSDPKDSDPKGKKEPYSDKAVKAVDKSLKSVRGNMDKTIALIDDFTKRQTECKQRLTDKRIDNTIDSLIKALEKLRENLKRE